MSLTYLHSVLPVTNNSKLVLDRVHEELNGEITDW